VKLPKAEIDARPGRWDLTVDGQPVTIAASADIHVDCESIPVVTVQLISPVRIALEHARIEVAEQAKAELIAMGWAPPPSPGAVITRGRQHEHGDLRPPEIA
jgi:hypothetical protein